MVLVGLFVKMTKNRKFFAMKKLGFTRVDLDTDKTEELVKKIIKNKEKYSLISTECTEFRHMACFGFSQKCTEF